MKLYYNPLSSYSQKVLVAFYEKELQFTPEIVDMMNPALRADYEKNVNIFGKVPTLVLDNGHRIPESSIIIEYLEGHHGKSGTRLIPEDVDAARQARFLDRYFDLYINDPMAKIFFDGMKPEGERDPKGVAAAKATMDKAYKVADEVLIAGRTWGIGDTFSLADCSAAPALAYARMVYPFEQHKNLVAYANRLAERPSFSRVRTEAAPFMAKMMQR
jgi:glutathione S-transferase